jgi:hypothetical protein
MKIGSTHHWEIEQGDKMDLSWETNKIHGPAIIAS